MSNEYILKDVALDALKAQADIMRTWVERYDEQKRGILTAVNIIEDVEPAEVVSAKTLQAKISELKYQMDCRTPNVDYYTGYMSALSTIEGILAAMREE